MINFEECFASQKRGILENTNLSNSKRNKANLRYRIWRRDVVQYQFFNCTIGEKFVADEEKIQEVAIEAIPKTEPPKPATLP